MYTFAFALLVFAMLLALGGASCAVLTLWQRSGLAFSRTDVPTLRLIERANLVLTLCMTLVSMVLVYALVVCDFSLVYVAGYTDKALPLFYRITAFWAGQAGSLLFWAFSIALCGGLFQLSAAFRSLSTVTRLWYWTFYLGTMAFFGLLLTTWSNPFLMYHSIPADGSGLNPLLQNPGMIFHPPLLFLGYGGFVIPGCLALAQSLSAAKALEAPWTQVARPFTLTGWAFLTSGIVLGAWWAYMELGWGGYWAWDPVENASLIPWLVATAALHTMLIETRRNKLHGVNVFLMTLTTISAFFATYLVRSGVVQSVHAFGSGGVGGPLLLFILGALIVALWAALLARDPATQNLEGLESREGFLVLTSWLLLALSAIILVATMWPVFSAFWQENILGLNLDPASRLDAAGHDHGGAVGLTADFYNRVCLPLFAALVALLALCPWLGWNGKVRSLRGLALVLAAFAGATGTLWSFGYTQPAAVLGAGAAVAVMISLILLVLTPQTRHGALTPAHGIHLGVALVALGIAFSGPYKLEVEAHLLVGETAQAGDYTVTLKNLYTGRGPDYEFLESELEVRKNGVLAGISSPQRRVYPKWGQMQFAEAATIPSLGNEFYATLLAVDKQNKVLLRLSSNPLVNWIWIGGALMSLLPLFMLRRPKNRPPLTSQHSTAN